MEEFRRFLNSTTIYAPEDINEVIDLAFKDIRIISRYSPRSKVTSHIYNASCAFDTETSSFYTDDKQKQAIMYEWTLGLNGLVIIGRTWQQFITVCEVLVNRLGLDNNTRLIIYVHNLAFDFQFMRKWFDWLKVFSLNPRKPIYAIATCGLEFRCSYILSGYGLAKLGSQCRTYPQQKKVGDLDYKLVRHPETPLTDKEIGYCVADVKVVMAYVQEQIEIEENITKIPLTKTGYVRRYCRESCFTEKGQKKSYKRWRYLEIMKDLKIQNTYEMKQLMRGFQGGFTHTNPLYSGKTMYNVASDDFNSSYPAVIVMEMFPMSCGEEIEITSKREFEFNLKHYCCLFDLEIFGLQSEIYTDNYISESHCYVQSKVVAQNGRVVSADHIIITVTDIDFAIIRKFYSWKTMRVAHFRRYRKDYLPTDFIKAVLDFYNQKTSLKGVVGKEAEYMVAKEMLNSTYGMMVTSIIRPEVTYYEDEWGEQQPDLDEVLEKYNDDKNRFLFYPWGVWVTAYARRNLFTGILNFGNDYIYADTDSIKSINRERHQDYIDRYNKNVEEKLYRAMDYHNLPHEMVKPKTKNGVEKLLGVWDAEHPYKRFKALGAKRYMTETEAENGELQLSITVSGLNKLDCAPYLLHKYGDKVFEAFSDDLYIPPKYTGKNTHTYIDEEMCGMCIDYLNNKYHYDELSGVHLEESDYSLSIAREYADYIMGIQYSSTGGKN